MKKEKDKISETDGQLADAELESKTGQVTAMNCLHSIRTLTVIGQIEGHYVLSEQNKTTRYEHIIPALTEAEQDRSIEGLLMILNTVGGDVEAGLAIAELIAGIP